MTSYDIVEVLSPGLIRILRSDECAMWVAGKTRKEAVCVMCRKMISKGTVGFRPLANPMYRYERVCGTCAGTVTEP